MTALISLAKKRNWDVTRKKYSSMKLEVYNRVNLCVVPLSINSFLSIHVRYIVKLNHFSLKN